MHPLVSFVIPAYNVGSKVERCLASLDEMHLAQPSMEAVFVDDFSSDGTLARLEDFSRTRDWVFVERMPVNSGSPSRPRNVGLDRTMGEYVFFLDPDDEVVPAGVLAEIEIADRTRADVVRAPLERRDGRTVKVMNRLATWDASWDRSARIRALVAGQSTTVCGLVRRSLLQEHSIRWPEHLRLGEDTVFLVEVLAASRVIEYSEQVDFIYHTEYDPANASSTQQYQDRELLNHVAVWRHASHVLSEHDVDYFACRGQVALQASLAAMIRFNRGGVSEHAFEEFAAVLRDNEGSLREFGLSARFRALLQSAVRGDRDAFNEGLKPRLVIAGMDLKFIQGAVSALEEHFQVRIDQWSGHDKHDEAISRDLLEWADVIHCEWLLGNAVWYSRRKRPGQRLTVRTHLFEMDREYGDLIDRDAVDVFIAVSLPTLEDIQARFAFPRERVRLIPNFIDVQSYQRSADPSRVFNLAIVGVLPARKGYHRALELLRDLRMIDQRYNLTVFGKMPVEVPWVVRDPDEREYYEYCDAYITRNALDSAITFAGWVDMREALAGMGVVLSVSDFESFHVAPAEAFAAGNVALFLPWRGVEYIYPAEYICENLERMRECILALRDLSTFNTSAATGAALVRERYSLGSFVGSYVRTVREVL